MSSSMNLPVIPSPDVIDQEPIPVEDIDLEGGDPKHTQSQSFAGGDVEPDITAVDSQEEDGDDDNNGYSANTNMVMDGSTPKTGNGVSKRCRNMTIIFGLVIGVVVIVIGVTLGTAQTSSTPPPSSSASSSPATFDTFSCRSAIDETMETSSSWSSCPALANTINDGSIPNRTAIAQPVGGSIDGESSGDLFGMALSVNCDATVVAIGSSMHDGRDGHVKVYKWISSESLTAIDGDIPADVSRIDNIDGTWMQMGKTLDGTMGSSDQFGHAVVLSADGSRLAISGRFDDTKYDNGTIANENVGSVRIFTWSTLSGEWQPTGQVIWGEAASDQFGRSVDMNFDGTRLLVGAPQNDDSANQSGHARVYELTSPQNTWKQLGRDIDGESEEDYSGAAVSMSTDGNVVAIGAYKNDGADGATLDAGHVRVYTYDASTGNWTQVGQDIDGDSEGDWHGNSVALSADGSRLVVGVPGNNDRFLPGVSKVYKLVDGNWEQIGDDLEGGGYSVDISYDGNRVALGSHRGFENGPNTGQVLVYDFDETDQSWIAALGEASILGERGSMFGTAVAMSKTGDRVLASAPAGSNFVGSVTAYDLCPVA